MPNLKPLFEGQGAAEPPGCSPSVSVLLQPEGSIFFSFFSFLFFFLALFVFLLLHFRAPLSPRGDLPHTYGVHVFMSGDLVFIALTQGIPLIT